MTDRTRGILFALIGTTLWSTTGVFTSYLLTHFGIQPVTLAFLRDLMASLSLIAVLAVINRAALRLTWRDVPFFVLYGCIGMAAMNVLWAYSVQYNGAAVATVLAYASPAFTVLLAKPLLKEPWTPIKIAAVLVSLAGCALVARAYQAEAWQINLAGILTGVGTGLAFTCMTLAGRWSNRRFASPWTLSAYGFLFAAVTLALAQRPQAVLELEMAWQGWAILAGLALGPSLIGFGLFTASLRLLPAGIVGLITPLEPALASILAMFVLGERLDLLQWLGLGCILIAVVMVQGEAARGGAAVNKAPATSSA